MSLRPPSGTSPGKATPAHLQASLLTHLNLEAVGRNSATTVVSSQHGAFGAFPARSPRTQAPVATEQVEAAVLAET